MPGEGASASLSTRMIEVTVFSVVWKTTPVMSRSGSFGAPPVGSCEPVEPSPLASTKVLQPAAGSPACAGAPPGAGAGAGAGSALGVADGTGAGAGAALSPPLQSAPTVKVS